MAAIPVPKTATASPCSSRASLVCWPDLVGAGLAGVDQPLVAGVPDRGRVLGAPSCSTSRWGADGAGGGASAVPASLRASGWQEHRVLSGDPLIGVAWQSRWLLSSQ